MYSKYSILILFFLLFSCNEDIEDCEIKERISDVSELSSYEIPRNFNFNTTETINVNVDVKSIYGIPLSGVKVSFYSSNPDFGGRHISSAFTSLTGSINLPILIPTYQEDLFVQVHSKGFANQRSKSVDQNMYFSFGGVPEERTKENLKDPSLIPISDKFIRICSEIRLFKTPFPSMEVFF